MHLEPPYGYWCSSKPPRSPDQGHRSPSGLDFSGQLPNAPYANPVGVLVRSLPSATGVCVELFMLSGGAGAGWCRR